MIVDIPEAALRRVVRELRQIYGTTWRDANTIERAMRRAAADAKAQRPKRAEPNEWQAHLAVRAEIEGRASS